MEVVIQSLLRPTEQVRLTLQTTLVREKGPDPQAEEPLEGSTPGSENEPRFIAIISHKDAWNGEDEGCIFVLKQQSSSEDNGLDLERVYPIDDTFVLSIAQTQRTSIDSPRTRKSTDEAAQRGFAFSLTSKYMDDLSPPRPTLYFTDDIARLRSFSTACNEIRNTYEAKQDVQVAAGVTAKFQWLEPYVIQSGMFAAFSTQPQDLRIINQPLHTRLSSASAGLPGDDLADLALIRDEWIRNTSRSQSVKGQRALKIRLGTFNVNDQLASQDLSSWLQGKVPNEYGKIIPPVDNLSPLPLDRILSGEPPPQAEKNANSAFTKDDIEDDPDLIVLGFQELDLSTEALLYTSSTLREDAWYSAAIASLGEKGAEYRKLASKQLVGMLMIILVKSSVAYCFSDIRLASAGVGVLGVMGNKGGVAIGLTYTPPTSDEVSWPGPTTFAFANAHLAAFDEQYEKRNSDYRDLAKRLILVDQAGASVTRSTSIFESDYLFWMGDLNYRLEVPDPDIRAILGANYLAGRLEVLQKYDQLRLAQSHKRAFEGFQEPPITFLPTYRFSPGVVRDGLDYDIKRKPAWTDRILYMASPSGNVHPISYLGHPHIKISDHKPVSSDYQVGVDIFDGEARTATAKLLYKSVHALDDPSAKRELKLDTTIVDFGEIHYLQEDKRTLTVRNTSKVPCAYRFVASEEESSTSPDWLTMKPMHALLLPDESVEITLTVLVDNASAQDLNLSGKDLRVTLILHTMLGKDHFISVTGKYQYTCFSNKLSTLTRLPDAIRNVESVSQLLPEKEHINAPKEIMRLVNWLMSAHAETEGLFVEPGKDEDVRVIREHLDTGEEFPFHAEKSAPALHLAFGTTLLRFLDSLTESVVPSALHMQCAQMTSRDEAFELLDAFPSASVNVWISVTAYLHFICQTAPTPEKKTEKAKQLALVFAPILLRDDPEVVPPPISILAKIGFLLYFIS